MPTTLAHHTSKIDVDAFSAMEIKMSGVRFNASAYYVKKRKD